MEERWKSDGRAMEERWKCMEVRGRAVGMLRNVMQSEGTRCGRVVEEPRGEDVRDVRDVPRIFTTRKLWTIGMFETGARRQRVVGIIRD